MRRLVRREHQMAGKPVFQVIGVNRAFLSHSKAFTWTGSCKCAVQGRSSPLCYFLKPHCPHKPADVSDPDTFKLNHLFKISGPLVTSRAPGLQVAGGPHAGRHWRGPSPQLDTRLTGEVYRRDGLQSSGPPRAPRSPGGGSVCGVGSALLFHHFGGRHKQTVIKLHPKAFGVS